MMAGTTSGSLSTPRSISSIRAIEQAKTVLKQNFAFVIYFCLLSKLPTNINKIIHYNQLYNCTAL